MTKQELQDFCIENAGKIASGRYSGMAPNKLPRVVKGRIIAFTVNQFNQALILLEDEKGKDKPDLPNPLPAVPHFQQGWHRLISPAKLGYPVLAETVVVEAEVSDQSPTTAQTTGGSVQRRDVATHIPDEDEPKAVCIHKQCDPGWCHLKYAGII